MMNRYEMIYIIDADLEEAARKELIEKVSALITNNGGEIEKVDETWGKRRLAYAIDYKTEGWYVLVNAERPAPVAAPVDEAPAAEEAAPVAEAVAAAAEEAPAADAE